MHIQEDRGKRSGRIAIVGGPPAISEVVLWPAEYHGVPAYPFLGEPVAMLSLFLKEGPGPISETCLTCLRHCSCEFYLSLRNASVQACGGVEHYNIVLEPGHLTVASLSNMCSNSHSQQGIIDPARNSVTQVLVFLVMLAFCCSSDQRCPPLSPCSQPHHIILLSVYSAVPDDIALCVC